MIFFKLSEDLIINLEHIYILSKSDNEVDIKIWESNYEDYLKELTQKPIPFNIDGEYYIPNFNEVNNDLDKLSKYMKELDSYIIEIIGKKPTYKEIYFTILNTGNKIEVSKEVYIKLKEELEKYDIKKNNQKVESN